MVIHYYSLVSYNVGTPGETYTIPFPYIAQEDVVLYRNGEPFSQSNITWTSDNTVTVANTAENDELYFRRYTKKDRRLVVYQGAGVLNDEDLNLVTTQLLYLIQELWDYGIAGTDPNAPPGSNGEPGGGDGLPEIIDNLVQELLNTQLFQNLIELIELSDINAEAIMFNTLSNHNNWSTARFVERVTNDNTTGIFQLEETVVDGFQASNTRIDVLQSVLDSNSALIAHIDQTYVDAEAAIALITTELETAFTSPAGLLQTSAYVNGIKSTANANSAHIEGIESFLVGSGGDVTDPSTWGADALPTLVSGLQTLTSAHADQLTTEANFRQAMFSAFYPQGNVDTHLNQMIAAMEDKWQTYADEESSTASRIFEMEVNTQPIFLRSTPPDPRSTEFSNRPWGTGGFPPFSIWWDTTNNTRLIRYWWHSGSTLPPGITFDQVVLFNDVYGMWVRAIDDEVYSQGVRIDSIETAYNQLGLVGGSISNTIQAVLGDNIAAIEERLDTWIDTEDGLMYSGWDVRINQYQNGVPVIAGVGLGMQQDPNNPEAGSRSDFIVMADHFSIVAPPTSGGVVDGEWDTSSLFVPFMVNTGNVPGEPDIIVNGDMFVRNTLSAMDGMAGRFTFTDLDSSGYPVVRDSFYRARGSRLALCSSTNGYNVAEDGSASPFSGGSNPQKFWLWAGEGTMNHNNSVFYIDTDGNAHFDGEVSAENINGDLSNVHVISVHNGTTTVPTHFTGWTTLGDTIGTPASLGRPHRASATVSISMFGQGQSAGRARLLISHESSPGSNSFINQQVVSEYPIGMEIGTTLTLSGAHSSRVRGKWRVEVQIARQLENNGSSYGYPSSSGYDGTLLMIS